MRIHVDKRIIEATPIEGGAEILRGMADDLLEIRLRLARFLAKVEETRHFETEGAASVAEYSARFGIPRFEAIRLRDLGLALRSHAELERALREGETDAERAMIVSRILKNPAMLHPGDDWVGYACDDDPKDLRRRVRVRVEEFAQQSRGVVEINVHVRPETKKAFLRVRDVASSKEKVVLTYGQTLHRLVNFYLDHNDPDRVRPGKRRVPDTNTLPESRYVPPSVVRQIFERSAGTCEFPGCDHHVFTELAHVKPHAKGSGREACDFFHFCTVHHKLYDAHLIRFIGGSIEDPVFWIKRVGTISAEDVAPKRSRRSNRGRARGDGGDDTEPSSSSRRAARSDSSAPSSPQAEPEGEPIDPDGGDASTVQERIVPLNEDKQAYPLFEDALVHC